MSGALEVRPVTEATRADFEAFFTQPGAPKYCWCMAWRRTREELKSTGSEAGKRQMMRRIDEGVPVGLLAYEDGAPIGWVSVAPRDTFRNLGGPEAEPGQSIWSIVCFYVPRKRRGDGLVRRLLAAAVAHARQRGATIVEAYPVDADSPSYRFMGFVSIYEEAGFVEVGRAGSRRHVMRRAVRRASRR